MKQQTLTQYLREEQTPGWAHQLQLVIQLSVPAILAQISSTVMQYIDAAMVGSLGANASAAIGLVTSSTWLLNGLCMSLATGFAVQVAHLVGAGRQNEAKEVFRQSILAAAVFSLLIAAIGALISFPLPRWLGGKPEIRLDSTYYFLTFACSLPAIQFRLLAGGMLQSSGDMKTPSLLNILMCALDVVFNSFLIFPTREVSLSGLSLVVPGAGLGVAGAALGTALSEAVVALLMLWAACIRSEQLRLTGTRGFRLNPRCFKSAARIAIPLAIEHSILSSAQITSTHIVAPLGTVSIAANSLAVTAESLCYLPGYGIASAATTLVGQSIGADRRDMARRFARLSVLLGMTVMGLAGILMFMMAPFVFTMLTPDPSVQRLGVEVLRIEVFAEPLFAAAIVTAGALRGAGDAKVPSLINLISMWGIRITSASLLAPRLGLRGVWIAMCGELCIRGTLFIIRLLREKWLRNILI